MADDFRYSSDERTIPSRRGLRLRADDANNGGATLADAGGQTQDKTGRFARVDGGREMPGKDAPWVLQQYLNGRVDLDGELTLRFPAMPVISQIHVYHYDQARHGVATLATQDNAASLVVEVDVPTRAVQFAFQVNAMSLKFDLTRLSDRDRVHWLDTMRRVHNEQQGGEIAFLWSAARWNSDYLICAPHKHYTNVYAFSPLHVEAAARLTTEVTNNLVEWLESFWRPAEDHNRAPKMDTW